MTFWQHWHLLIKKTKQIKNTHPPECASWPARSAQDDSGSSSLGSPQSGKKTRCQNHMNSKLLQHHKILFCQFNICFCFHVTCFHHFLALQLTTILQKRQLTRNYLYDNPTTTNLYLWHPSFQFVRFLWGFFLFVFCLSEENPLRLQETHCSYGSHPCSLQTPPLFVKGCWALQCCMEREGEQEEKQKAKINAVQTDCEGSRDAPFSKQKCENLYGYSQRQTQSRSGFWQRRSGVLF